MGPNPIVLHVVDELDVSPSVVDTLKATNIYYIGDLIWRTEAELLQEPNISGDTVTELKEALRALGLDFRKN